MNMPLDPEGRRRFLMQLDYQETFARYAWHRASALAFGMLWPLFATGLLGWLRVSKVCALEHWAAFVRNPLTWRVRRADEVHDG